MTAPRFTAPLRCVSVFLLSFIHFMFYMLFGNQVHVLGWTDYSHFHWVNNSYCIICHTPVQQQSSSPLFWAPGFFHIFHIYNHFIAQNPALNFFRVSFRPIPSSSLRSTAKVYQGPPPPPSPPPTSPPTPSPQSPLSQTPPSLLCQLLSAHCQCLCGCQWL